VKILGFLFYKIVFSYVANNSNLAPVIDFIFSPVNRKHIYLGFWFLVV